MKPIETKVSETLLQEKKVVRLGGADYEVAPPTIATLVKVSELVATLPGQTLDNEKVLGETLRIAKDCKALAEIMAVMIQGVQKPVSRLSIHKSDLKKLSQKLLYSASPVELKDAMMELLAHLQVGDFFGLTAFLLEVGITKMTRKAETTVSGPQSPVSLSGTVLP